MIGSGRPRRPEPTPGSDIIVIRRWKRGPARQNREFGGKYVGRGRRFTANVTTPEGGGQRWTNFRGRRVTQGRYGRQVPVSRIRHVVVRAADEDRVTTRIPKRVPATPGSRRRRFRLL